MTTSQLLRRSLLLAVVTTGASVVASPAPASAQSQSGWGTDIRVNGSPGPSAALTTYLYGGSSGSDRGYTEYCWGSYSGGHYVSPTSSPSGTSFQARVNCYTNAAHSGAYVVLYSGNISGSAPNTCTELKCPVSNPFS